MQVVGAHHRGNQMVGLQQGSRNQVGVVRRVGRSLRIVRHILLMQPGRRIVRHILCHIVRRILLRRLGHMVGHSDHSICYEK